MAAVIPAGVVFESNSLILNYDVWVGGELGGVLHEGWRDSVDRAELISL